MEMLETIKARHSVRAYKSTEVEIEKLNQILDAARLAPTANNCQGYRVVVIPTAQYRGELRKIYDSEWFTQPPYVLGIYAVPGEYGELAGDPRNIGEIDASIVFSFILLAATGLGLGTCWVGAFNLKAAKELPKIQAKWEPIAFSPLGYFDEVDNQRRRRNLDELIIHI